MSANANTPMAGQGDPAGLQKLDGDWVQWSGNPPMDKHIKPMAPGEIDFGNGGGVHG